MSWGFVLTVGLPIVGLIILLILLLLLCNHQHKKKMLELGRQEQALLQNGEIRAEAVGDTTLRVGVHSFLIIFSVAYYYLKENWRRFYLPQSFQNSVWALILIMRTKTTNQSLIQSFCL